LIWFKELVIFSFCISAVDGIMIQIWRWLCWVCHGWIRALYQDLWRIVCSSPLFGLAGSGPLVSASFFFTQKKSSLNQEIVRTSSFRVQSKKRQKFSLSERVPCQTPQLRLKFRAWTRLDPNQMIPSFKTAPLSTLTNTPPPMKPLTERTTKAINNRWLLFERREDYRKRPLIRVGCHRDGLLKIGFGPLVRQLAREIRLVVIPSRLIWTFSFLNYVPLFWCD